MNTTTKTIPPYAAEAEAITLGAMMLDPAALAKARRIVGAEDFFSPRNRVLYAALVDLARAGLPLEVAALSAFLKKRGQLDAAGGDDWLNTVADGVPSTASVAHYAGLVREKADLRKAIALCNEVAEGCYDPVADAGAVVEELQRRAYALTRHTDGRHVTVAGAIELALDHAGKVEKGEIPPALTTGFSALDAALGGLKPGQLVTLAAETSAGKSTFAMNIAENVLTAGGAVLIASAEMTAMQIGRRILASQCRIPGRRIEQGMSNRSEEWTELHILAGKAAKWRGEILTGKCSVADIVLRARELVGQWGTLDLIIADYLQLLTPGRGDNRAQQISGIAWDLKLAAVELGCPILMLSQLSRAGQGREEGGNRRRPELWHLKESGDIENHSDVVLLLHQPDDAAATVTGWPVCLRIAKNRDGLATPWEGPGAIALRWNPTITRFEPFETGSNDHD